MDHFVSVDKFSILLKEVDLRNYLLIKPVLYLEIAWEVLLKKLLQFSIQSFFWSALSKWKIFIVSVDAEIFSHYVVKII